MPDIDNIMKLLLEAIEAWKKIEENINAETNRRRRKRLLKACKKALKTGADKDLAAVRKHLFLIARR